MIRPRLAEWLLGRLLGTAGAVGIVGDLEELAARPDSHHHGAFGLRPLLAPAAAVGAPAVAAAAVAAAPAHRYRWHGAAV